MAVDFTNKQITDPIGLSEVARFFGSSRTDLAAMIKGIKSQVNRYSRVKPVISNAVTIGTFGAYSGKGYWGLNIYNKAGTNISSVYNIFQGNDPAYSFNEYMYPNSDTYTDSNQTKQQAFRMGDFRGYNGTNNYFTKFVFESNIGYDVSSSGNKIVKFNKFFDGVYFSMTAEFTDYMPWNDWFNGETDWYFCVEFVRSGNIRYFFYKRITSNRTTLKFVDKDSLADGNNGVFSLENSVFNSDWSVYPAFVKIYNGAPSQVMLSPNWIPQDAFTVKVSKESSSLLKANLEGLSCTYMANASNLNLYSRFDPSDKVICARVDIIAKLTIKNVEKPTFITGRDLFFSATLTTVDIHGGGRDITTEGFVLNPNALTSNRNTNYEVAISKNQTTTLYVLFPALVPNQDKFSAPTRGDYIEIKASGSRGGAAFTGDSSGLNCDARAFHAVLNWDNWPNSFSGNSITNN